MKVFTSEGIEKEDNADVLVELETISTRIASLSSQQEAALREFRITNLHLGILNDQHIEEPL
jgi:Tfp pilus assembly PilM family ATPase